MEAARPPLSVPLQEDVLQRVLEFAAQSSQWRVIGSVVQWHKIASLEVAQFSLVSRSWLEPAQRVLYRSVVLDTSRRADQFARTCGGRPALGRLTRALSLGLTEEIYGAPNTDFVAASERMVDAVACCSHLKRISTLVYWEMYNEKGVLLPHAALANILVQPSLRILDLTLYQPNPSERPQLNPGSPKSSAPHLETLSLWQGGAAGAREPDFNGHMLQILSGNRFTTDTTSFSFNSSYERSSISCLRHLSLESLQLGPGPSYPSWLLHSLPYFHHLEALKVPLQDLDQLLPSLPPSVKHLSLGVDARDDFGQLDPTSLASVLRNLPQNFPASLNVLEIALQGEPKGERFVPLGADSAVACFRALGVSLIFVGEGTPLVSIFLNIWML